MTQFPKMELAAAWRARQLNCKLIVNNIAVKFPAGVPYFH